MGVTIDDARAIAATLPRSYELLVRERAKFRVDRIVYAAFSRDKTIMGFGFPSVTRPRAMSLPLGRRHRG